MRRNCRLSNRGYAINSIVLLFFIAFITAPAQQHNWQADLRLAKYYAQNDQIDEALIYYEQSWQKSKFIDNVFSPYYQYLVKVKAFEKAEEISKAMRKRHPDNIKYTNNTGKAIALQERYREAALLWQDYLKKYGRSPSQYQSVSNEMLKSRMFEQSVAILLEAYEKFPNQKAMLLQIANLYQWRLSFVEATKYYIMYLQKNTPQFSMVLNRILQMLDSYSDAAPVIDYLKRLQDNFLYSEIISSIYFKFEKYDLALPVMKSNYNPVQFTRFLHYAKQAQTKGNSVFAEQLLSFLGGVEKDPVRKREIKLLGLVIQAMKLSPKAPIDSVNMIINGLDNQYQALDKRQKIVATRLYVSIYHNLLNDLDATLKFAGQGLKISQVIQDKEYFILELIRTNFEYGNFKECQKQSRLIRTPQNRDEAEFYILLSGYATQGFKTLRKNSMTFFQKVKPREFRYNDVIKIRLMNASEDSTMKKQLMDGLVYMVQKRYAQAENNFLAVFDDHFKEPLAASISLEWLSQTARFTGSTIFTEKAKEYMEVYPGNKINSRLLWLLSVVDPDNSSVYHQQILEYFPNSLEAKEVRLLKNQKGIVG